MIVYVQKDETGHIICVFAGDQEGMNLIPMDDQDPEVQAFLNPPPPPYVIPADIPWTRMTDEEAELVQGGIDASPIKTRNMINKATSFTFGTDAFNKFLAIITAAIDSIRAGELLGPLLASEAATMELA